MVELYQNENFNHIEVDEKNSGWKQEQKAVTREIVKEGNAKPNNIFEMYSGGGDSNSSTTLPTNSTDHLHVNTYV